jgi:hypothetical protein
VKGAEGDFTRDSPDCFGAESTGASVLEPKVSIDGATVEKAAEGDSKDSPDCFGADSADGATGEKGAEGDFIEDSPGCVAVASTRAMVLGDKDSGDCATGEKGAE